ncbi:helix-turn-helix domain-containing protein [Ruminiclostridium cellulolyticum]|nr:helix-turn-helix domain-containing protein [Ruminiclostridium cellulolyticum]
MEKEGTGVIAEKSYGFLEMVKKAQQGDKEAMDKILELFTPDIDYLSRYIMLPREDAIQTLKTELMSIIYFKL